jgi:hypothetical protein
LRFVGVAFPLFIDFGLVFITTYYSLSQKDGKRVAAFQCATQSSTDNSRALTLSLEIGAISAMTDRYRGGFAYTMDGFVCTSHMLAETSVSGVVLARVSVFPLAFKVDVGFVNVAGEKLHVFGGEKHEPCYSCKSGMFPGSGKSPHLGLCGSLHRQL